MTRESAPVLDESAPGRHATGQRTALVEAALIFAGCGWPVVPLHDVVAGHCSCQYKALCTSPGKHPRTLNGVKDATTDAGRIREWWDVFPHANVGVATGAEWSRLFAVDEDVARRLEELWPEVMHQLIESGQLVVQTTPNGRHLLFAAPAGLGNSTGGKARSLGAGIDTRGTGGYIVAEPSVTPDGTYAGLLDLAARWPVTLPELPPQWLDALRPTTPPGRTVSRTAAPDDDRITRYVSAAVESARRELAESAPGTRNHTLNEVAFRLGTLGGRGVLADHTARAELSAAWSALGKDREPGGAAEFAKTFDSGWSAGLERPREPWPPADRALPDVGFAAPAAQGAPSSWAPVDLTDVLDGTHEPVEPTIGHRADGARVLYPGKEHVIAGEPESGKTWFALKLVRDVLVDGGRVLYVDFEDDAQTVVGRLQTFGLLRTRFDPAVFRYVRPEHAPSFDELSAALTFPGGPATLVVFDGWTEGASLLGLDIMSQDDIARWRRVLIRPCLAVGAATLTTDHVVKDREQRGRFSIGAGHKLAGLTGAMFIAETQDTWGKGCKGRSRILISKDRNGGLRSRGKRLDGAANMTHFGDLVGDAESGDMTSVVLYAPYNADGSIGYTRKQREAVRKILRYVADAKTPPVKSAVKSAVGGSGAEVGNLIDRLKGEGYLATVKDGRYDGYVLGAEEFETDES